TIDIFRRRSRYTANQVTWINVLQVYLHSAFREEFIDLFFEKEANIPRPMIARSIRSFGTFVHQVLPRSLGDNDHRVFSTSDSMTQHLQQPSRTFQGKFHFWNQTEIGVLTSQRGETGNKSRFASHQLYKSDPVHGTQSFDMSRRNRLDRLRKRRLKPEALVDVHDIVVDSFRNADQALFQVAPADLGAHCFTSAQRSFASD